MSDMVPPVISDRAKALIWALDGQNWKGPGHLDVARMEEIVQMFLEDQIAETRNELLAKMREVK